MSLLSQTALFCKLASPAEQLKDLAKQALTDDGAWAVLTDRLIELGQLEPIEEGFDRRTYRRLMRGEVRVWMIDNFFSPIKQKLAKDIQIGDVADMGVITHVKHTREEYFNIVRIVFDGNQGHKSAWFDTGVLRVQEPPDDWDRKLVAKRLAWR